MYFIWIKILSFLFFHSQSMCDGGLLNCLHSQFMLSVTVAYLTAFTHNSCRAWRWWIEAWTSWSSSPGTRTPSEGVASSGLAPAGSSWPRSPEAASVYLAPGRRRSATGCGAAGDLSRKCNKTILIIFVKAQENHNFVSTVNLCMYIINVLSNSDFLNIFGS